MITNASLLESPAIDTYKVKLHVANLIISNVHLPYQGILISISQGYLILHRMIKKLKI